MDMLNAVKSVLADVSSVSPSSELRSKLELCSDKGLMLERSANTLFTAFSISSHQPCVDILLPRQHRPKLVLTGTSIPLYYQSRQ